MHPFRPHAVNTRWFCVLFTFCFTREGAQGPPLVNPWNNVCLKIYDANHFIFFFLKQNHFENGLKTCRLYILYRYCTAVLLEYLNTSFIMNFLALDDDVKFIISKHLASDLKIRTFLSKIMTFKRYYLETSCKTMIFVNI